jgi:hypothetical protein
MLPLVPAVVVAQVSRSERQAQLRQLLRGCEIVAFAESDGHRVGALLGKAQTKDIVDAAVVTLAIERKAEIQTSDAADLRRLSATARAKLSIVEV